MRLLQPDIHLVWRVYDWETEYGVQRRMYVIGNNRQDHRQRCNGRCILQRTQRCVVAPIRQEITGAVTPERKEIYD